MTTRNGPGWETIETATPPPCGPCQRARTATWNGRLPEAGRLARQAPHAADYYVLVRGTTGLFRHECRAVQRRTQDRILVRLVPPRGDIA
jgi:hypothetical protein